MRAFGGSKSFLRFLFSSRERERERIVRNSLENIYNLQDMAAELRKWCIVGLGEEGVKSGSERKPLVDGQDISEMLESLILKATCW